MEGEGGINDNGVGGGLGGGRNGVGLEVSKMSCVEFVIFSPLIALI